MEKTEPAWDLYRSFLAVLQHGSLSAAARELALTQPTIGRHIDALETLIGTELFTRSQLGLLPTDAAIDLRPYAETMAATASALLRSASGLRGQVSGTVRISASEVIGVEVLPPIIARLQDDYPGLTIELSASDAVEDLLQRQADIAVRMTEPSQAALVVRRIGDIKLGLFAHRRYLERYGTPQSLADLAGHRIIGFDRQSAYIRAMVRRYPLLDPQTFAFKADSTLAQNAAIRAGVGIGLCQRPLGYAAPDLVHLLPDVEIPLRTWVAMHENLKGSPRCRVTFDALVSGLLDYMLEKYGR
jgi:DNA-binding transcriptional LysR family regulator